MVVKVSVVWARVRMSDFYDDARVHYLCVWHRLLYEKYRQKKKTIMSKWH